MSKPLAPLPTVLGRVFTSAEARAAGVQAWRLRHPDVERILYGVYRRVVPRSNSTPNAATPLHPAEAWRRKQVRDALDVARALGEGKFFSHRTAAALLGLPVPSRNTDHLDIACFAPNRAPRGVGVRGRQLRESAVPLGTCRGVPVPAPAAVWAMLASELALHDLIALGDAVIRRPRIPGTNRLERPPFATIAELREAATSMRWMGSRRLAEALPQLTTASASVPESHLRLLCADWGLPAPELDVDIFDTRGRLLGCSELAWPEYRVVAEYEGDQHRSEVGQWNRDIDKYGDYEEVGWKVVRVTADLQYRRASVLRGRLVRALRERGWSG
ncbi:hypothetical protein [Leucobacter sp. GX24907]